MKRKYLGFAGLLGFMGFLFFIFDENLFLGLFSLFAFFSFFWDNESKYNDKEDSYILYKSYAISLRIGFCILFIGFIATLTLLNNLSAEVKYSILAALISLTFSSAIVLQSFLLSKFLKEK